MLCRFLINLKQDSSSSIFLFLSPEKLLKEPWNKLMIFLIDHKILKLVCIDEVHQFVSFGSSFRRMFEKLKETLFSKIKVNEKLNDTGLKLPILFMTATFNMELCDRLETIIGIAINKKGFVWGDCDSMKRRVVTIRVDMCFCQLRKVCDEFIDTLKNNSKKKCIIYTNTAEKVQEVQKEIDYFLDVEEKISGDTLAIFGKLDSEVKFISVKEFTKIRDNYDEIIKNGSYFPRVLVATSSCIGAGLDSSDIYSVIRLGFPTSIIDLVQEMGRCGRKRKYRGNNGSDTYLLLLTLSDYVYLTSQIYEEKDKKEKDRLISVTKRQEIDLKNLQEVLYLMYGWKHCRHVYLEGKCANIEIDETMLRDCCRGSCPFCNDKWKNYIMAVRRAGLSAFLSHVFITGIRRPYSPIELVDALKKYEDVGKVIYGRKKSKNAPSSKFLQSTICQLLVSNICEIQINNKDDKIELEMKLSCSQSEPNYIIDKYWDIYDLI